MVSEIHPTAQNILHTSLRNLLKRSSAVSWTWSAHMSSHMSFHLGERICSNKVLGLRRHDLSSWFSQKVDRSLWSFCKYNIPLYWKEEHCFSTLDSETERISFFHTLCTAKQQVLTDMHDGNWEHPYRYTASVCVVRNRKKDGKVWNLRFWQQWQWCLCDLMCYCVAWLKCTNILEEPAACITKTVIFMASVVW